MTTLPFVATPSWERGLRPLAETPGPADEPDLLHGGFDHAAALRAELPEPSSSPAVARAADDALAVLGPLAPFAASGPVTDLFVNGAYGLWVDRGSGPELEPTWSADEGTPVELGGKRSGRVIYRTGWAEIRVSLEGKSVRVTASRPALALAVAKTLEI